MFVDDECRGVAERMYFPFDDRYYYLIQVYSNVIDGETLAFKYYNSNTGEVVEYRETLSFTSNMVVGDGFSPLGLSSEKGNTIIPDEYSLSNAYPNPFNPVTQFTYSMPEDSEVLLKIYNLQGREVASLINGKMDAGYHSVLWNADSYSSGMYFVKMVAGEFVNTQKLMLVK